MVRQKHPPGLYVLFFTEMWERFSFYCMLAIFVLYMTESGHPLLEKNASQIYGLYLGFVYFTPFFGGLLADRAWGYRNTILAGAFIMGLGHLLLAVDHLAFFFGGLAALVIGNGLFKPNISTLVGRLYPPGDPRVDNAFTIFYMGINVGAFISPLIAQYLRKEYGYHTAFGAAGVGMGISIVIFLTFQRWVTVKEDRPATGPAVAEEVPPEVQRQRHVALLIIFVIVALFWMGFKQNGNTFALWARDCTDRQPSDGLRGFLTWIGLNRFFLDKEGAFSTELFSTVNPLFVVAFSPLLVWLWGRLRAKGWEPSTPAKVGYGMVLAALAFVVLARAGLDGGDMGVVRQAKTLGQGYTAAAWADPTGASFAGNVCQGLAASEIGRVSAWNLLGAYAIITLAELFLSPMGLSLVSKLAAPKQRSTWMGGWFAATAIGGYLSGLVGQFWKEWLHSTFFAFLAATSLGAGLILLLFYRRIHAAMPVEKEVKPTPALVAEAEAVTT